MISLLQQIFQFTWSKLEKTLYYILCKLNSKICLLLSLCFFSIQTLHTQKKWQPLFLENLIAFAWKVNNNKFWTHFDRMNVASASSQQGPWPPPGGPNSLPGGPHMRPLGPRLSGSNRPPRPFFVREIYKNGYLKRLPYNEKKSSALSKLMKTDR